MYLFSSPIINSGTRISSDALCRVATPRADYPHFGCLTVFKPLIN